MTEASTEGREEERGEEGGEGGKDPFQRDKRTELKTPYLDQSQLLFQSQVPMSIQLRIRMQDQKGSGSRKVPFLLSTDPRS